MKCEVLVEGKCYCSVGSVTVQVEVLVRWKCWLGGSVTIQVEVLAGWKCYCSGGSVG